MLCPAEADWRIRRFKSCSSRRSGCPSTMRCWPRRRPRSHGEQRRVGRAHAGRRREFARAWPAGEIQCETDRADSWAAAERRRRPRPATRPRSFRARSGRCSIRFSACGRPVRDSRRASRCGSRSAPGWPRARDEAVALADQYHDLRVVLRAFELAWAHAQVELRHVHLSADKIHLFQRLASLLLYPDCQRNGAGRRLGGQSAGAIGLCGASAFRAIIRSCSPGSPVPIRRAWFATCCWRIRIGARKDSPSNWCFSTSSRPAISTRCRIRLHRLLGESSGWDLLNKRGGVFILQVGAAARRGSHSAAGCGAGRAARRRRLARQAARSAGEQSKLPRGTADRRAPAASSAAVKTSRRHAPNDRAQASPTASVGFSDDGTRIRHPARRRTSGRRRRGATSSPTTASAAWSPNRAAATPGAENSRENKLTGWSNDPVSDPPSEAIYIRDEETGDRWTPTPLPIRDAEPYIVRHGQGYTQFEHDAHGIQPEAARHDRRRRSGENLPPDAAKRFVAPAAAVRHRSASNGCSASIGEQTQMHVRHLARRTNRGAAGDQCIQSGVSPIASLSSTSSAEARTVTADRARILRPQRQLGQSGGAGARRTFRPRRRRARSVRRGANEGATCAGRGNRNRVPARASAQAAKSSTALFDATPSQQAVAAAVEPNAAVMGRILTTVQGAHAESGARSAVQSLAARIKR